MAKKTNKVVYIVNERQYRNAEALDELYGYVFSVDNDELVKSNDPRSPLAIGVGGSYVEPANDVEPKEAA
jgi:hypothetical protein